MDEPLKTATQLPQRVTWIGAVSFEERCLGALNELREAHRDIRAVLVDYPTVAKPEQLDIAWRESYRKRMMAQGLLAHESVIVDPYAYDEMNNLIAGHVKQGEAVVVDLTCFTKIHAMAFASWIAKAGSTSVYVAYTQPDNYGLLDTGKRSGWSDILVLPFYATAGLESEHSSRGLIVPGHEGNRLTFALAEIEPSAGLVMMGYDPLRPDLHTVCANRNRRVLKYLTEARRHAWQRTKVRADAWLEADDLATLEARAAKSAGAPLFLYPYGPKSLVTACAVAFAREYAEGSWFVYPIPRSYDVYYSEGIGVTHWFGPFTNGRPNGGVAL